MIKRQVIGLVVLFLFVFSFSFVHSDSSGIGAVDSAVGSVDNTIKTVQANATGVITAPPKTREQLKNDYIFKEFFGKEGLLERNKVVGPIFQGYKKMAVYTDPAVRYIVGVDPNLTWFFILVLITWIVMMKYYYSFYLVFRDFSLLSVNTIRLISLGLFAILTILQVFQNIAIFLVDKVFALIAVFSTGWMQVLGFFIFIVVLIVMGIFSKEIEVVARLIERKKKEVKKEQDDKDRAERLEHVIKREEKMLE